MKKILGLLALCITASGPALGGVSAIPTTINYQGTLKEKTLPANGTKKMLFRITDQNGTTVYWSSGQMDVPVNNGLFSAQLIPTGVPWDQITPYIEVTIETQLLTPREPIMSTVYANVSGTVIDKAITAKKLDPSIQMSISLPGMIVAYGGASVPAGWLPCDGSEVSRTDYAALFIAIGDSWGAGNNSTTFNVPDLRGRTAVGSGQGSGLTNRTVGEHTIGEEVHTLSIAEMPTHDHGFKDNGHTHPNGAIAGGGQVATGGSGFPRVNLQDTGGSNSGISFSPSGGSQPHNNMQPSAVVNYLIKI